MSRVRLLMSATTDLDADAHARWLVTRGGAEVEETITREWPTIGRAALRLIRRRADSDDALITIGEAALLAATFAWRGRHVHVPVGAPTAAECFALRRRPTVRVVVSAVEATRRLTAGGVSSSRVRTIAPAADDAAPGRAEARQRLQIDDGTLAIALPGTIRPGSGHRLSLWACALLAYRDRSWRFLVGRRGDDERATTLIECTREPGTRAFVRYREGDEPNALAAADMVVFANEGVPEMSMLDVALSLGQTIVAPQVMVVRERLPTANVFSFPSFHPRLIAKAVLQASDAVATQREPTPRPAIGTTWDDVLAAI